MSKVDYSIVDEKYYDTLCAYEEKIRNEKKVSCEEQENRLFSGFDDRQRILLELGVLKRTIEKDNELYMKYSNYFQDILSKYMVIELTSSVIPEVKEMIVLLDVACGLRIHLYSALPTIKEKLERKDDDEIQRVNGKL